ncbi:MAG TPA: SPOR domain-containing protein [Gammaproteobacteria bacterium]|jgi:cell division septation protein DedD|nr:SPOR domain-containing protein [Gammaproteobacteria bacterium]
MERHLKERIVGATVIVALGIIIIPWLLDGPAQSSRPVEQPIELPPVEQPGRTYTIPLDPAAGPAVPVDSGNGQPTQTRPAAGTIQRPSDDPPAAPVRQPDPQVTRPAEQPAQPPPRPSPTPQPAPAAQPPAPAADAEAWTVQVGSFSQADNAQALQARLKAEGFESFISRVATDAGTMHRVRVGPVPERAEADRLLTRLRAAGHGGARVVRAQD